MTDAAKEWLAARGHSAEGHCEKCWLESAAYYCAARSAESGMFRTHEAAYNDVLRDWKERAIEATSAGVCACGCGAALKRTRRGRPAMFLPGHNMRGTSRSKETRQLISDGRRRAWQEYHRRARGGAT